MLEATALPADTVAGHDPGGIGSGLRINAANVSRSVRGGHTVLRHISLSLLPGELVAIIGPSGAGKTSLLDVLAGGRSVPTDGTVTHNGHDPQRQSGNGSVGYVPQDDIIHRSLPLRRTLRYAAQLRLPAIVDSATVEASVTEVLSVLGLEQLADVRVGLLSGGERKRASVAVELLTRPAAIFLDEPTSGLDPANAAELMRVLRRLATAGSTVVLSTHNPADVPACDRVVVLAAGNLAYVGAPAAALRYFDALTVHEIYLRLAAETDPTTWSARWSAHRAPAEAAPTLVPPEHPPRPQDRRIGSLRQWLLLSRRNVDLLVSSRLTLIILLGSPVMILLMFLMLFRAGSFNPSDPSPNTTAMILFWIAFGGFFFGLTYGLTQICDEFAILRREKLVGLHLGAYTLSKLTALLPLLAVVDAALLGALRATDRLPPVGAAGLSSLFVTLLLTSSCALTLGLLASAAVSSPTQATLLLPMLCFPQVLFVGAFLPVPVMGDVGRWFSYGMSNRWAFEALGHTAGVETLWRDGTSPLGPPLLASYGDTFSHPVWQNWVILAGFTLVFAVATLIVLAARTGTRSSR